MVISDKGAELGSTHIQNIASRIAGQINRVIVGKPETVDHTILALLCEGHILIEDVPGVGKTTLAKAIAGSIGGEFRRVQFTPDLLPSDITGSSIFRQSTHEFEFQEGPLFTNVILVDEVNRATPKTQSALLEAMEENQVSSDGVTRKLPRPFFVLATQNNIEMTGTYPLPEAQLDRFFATVSIGYPDRESETNILKQQQISHPLDEIEPVVSLEELVQAQKEVKEIYVHDSIREYVVDIVRATRETSQLAVGSSPRGSIYLLLAGQAMAGMQGSEFVRPDDIKEIAPIILGHRVIVRGEVRAQGIDGSQIISQILESVPAPVPNPATA